MKSKQLISKISLWIQSLFYIAGGINHFISISFYIALIPTAIPFKPEVNIIAGIIEIILGVGLLVLIKYRKYISILIILFLLALMPTHIYQLNMGGCLSNGLCIPIWACWLRIVIQFVLMFWAWSVRKVK